MKCKTFLAELIFWLHFPVVFMTFIPFFVPRSIWPGKVSFQFWYVLFLIATQVGMGLYMMKYRKFGLVCPMTTVTQRLRGHKVCMKENHDHGCIREFSERIGVKLNAKAVLALTLFILAAVVVQYIWFR